MRHHLVRVFERPHTKQQKDAVQAIVEGRILDFTAREAEQDGVRIATRNIADFEKFVPHGLKLVAVETVTTP